MLSISIMLWFIDQDSINHEFAEMVCTVANMLQYFNFQLQLFEILAFVPIYVYRFV